MDRENRLGDRWPHELARALATCRVFVPLYSPRYFGSENCGMEWFAFARRLMKQKAKGLDAADAIIPALWAQVQPDSLPQVAKDIQYDHHGLSARYSAEGFYGLIKLDRYRRDYQLAVHRLAHRIVEVAERTEIGADKPADYASLQSAFGPAAGHRHMHITVLAPDASTLPKGRGADYYGKTPQIWSPYLPDYPQPLAEYAAGLTASFGCQPAVYNFDENSPYWAPDGRTVAPGLCLVDAWTALSPAHVEHLRRLNGLHEPWFSVLVPWNSQDTEMAGAERELREGLRLALGRKLESVPYRCRMAATGIPSLEDFGDLLPKMAMIMLKRFRKDGDVSVYPPEGSPIPRARIRRMITEDSEDIDE